LFAALLSEYSRNAGTASTSSISARLNGAMIE
jgi:hypothetical protein